MKRTPILLFLTLALAACGSATPPATDTAAPAQMIAGTITALNDSHTALTVAGQSLRVSPQAMSTQALGARSTASAVRVNGDDSNELALSLGQHVTVQASGEVAVQIDIEQELRGVLSSVDAAARTITVAGQNVTVAAGARIELSRQDSATADTGHTLADLAALSSPFVEVTGTRDAAGLLTATSIEVRSAAERHQQRQDDQAEVHGEIAALNTAAKTFTVLGTSVAYGQARVEGTPAEGLGVEVKGVYDPVSKLLTASKVEVGGRGGHGEAPAAGTAGAVVRLEGRVQAVDTAGKTVTVSHFKIDLSQATVVGSPAVGAEVQVTGTLDRSDLTLIHAATVRFQPDTGEEHGHR